MFSLNLSNVLKWLWPVRTEDHASACFSFASKSCWLSFFSFSRQFDCDWVEWGLFAPDIWECTVKNTLVSNLEPIIQNEVSQKEKDKYYILTHT